MYSFDGKIHELITYVDTGTAGVQYEYKFYNGNTTSQSETVPAACATANGNRSINVSADVVLTAVCFSQCILCTEVGMKENDVTALSIYPNPVTDFVYVTGAEVASVIIRDLSGRTVQQNKTTGSFVILEKEKFSPGIYYLECQTVSGENVIRKIIVE
jgi:hypothetical protein